MPEPGAATPRSRRTHTIRFRVTAMTTVAVTLLLGLTAVVLVVLLRTQLTSDLQATVRGRADELVGLVESGGLEPSLGSPIDRQDVVAQVVGPDGSVQAATTNAGGSPVVDLSPCREGWRTTRLPIDESPYRVLVTCLDAAQSSVAVVVAGNLDDVDESTQALARALGVAIPVLLGLICWLIWIVVGRTLRPIEAIRAEVEGIGPGDLTRRVREPGVDDEVDRLARTMNGMLARLDSAAARQQRFVADASHELRSPLTRMRTRLEVDRTHPESADLAASSQAVLDQTVRMQRLVDDLLVLARLDGTDSPFPLAPVDLDDVVLAEVRDQRAAGAPTLEVRGVSGAQVLGARDQLARAVHNVLDNACRHARTRVRVELFEDGADTHLVIEDDGPGIPAEERIRVFERFARLDEGRSSALGGTGLGLAITKEIVERHGGVISLGDGDAGGTRVRITLPRRPDGSSDG